MESLLLGDFVPRCRDTFDGITGLEIHYFQNDMGQDEPSPLQWHFSAEGAQPRQESWSLYVRTLGM